MVALLMAQILTLTAPHKPEGDQIKFWNLDTRFTVGCIGRQWGKSTMGQRRACRRVIQRPDANHWYVLPTIAQAKVQFRRHLKAYKDFIHDRNKSDMMIIYKNGGVITFKGADQPDNLKGETLTSATLDECATMHEEVWTEVIRPMLAVNRGPCDFIGTPKGKNWFFNLWQRAHEDTEFSWHHAPSNKSPFFSDEEFEQARRSTPEAIFRQEYLAEFLDEGSEVFRFFNDCIRGTLEDPQYDRHYIVGVDLAKHNDWTVITVWDVARSHMVYFDRFNEIEWPLQEQRIVAAATRYNNATVYLDASGVGDPVYDRLRHQVNVVPVKFTAPVKAHLVEKLAFALEKREITFPDIPEVISELRAFSIEKTPAGNIRYTAPEGLHDDIVMSMALAVAHLNRGAVIENVRLA